MPKRRTLETSFACGHVEVTEINKKCSTFINRNLWARITRWTGGGGNRKPFVNISESIRRSFHDCSRCEAIKLQVHDFEVRRDWIAIDGAEPLNRDGTKVVLRAAPAARGTAETLEAVNGSSSVAAEEAARKLRGVVKRAGKLKRERAGVPAKEKVCLTDERFEVGQAPFTPSSQLFNGSEVYLGDADAGMEDSEDWITTTGGVDVGLLVRLACRVESVMDSELFDFGFGPEVVSRVEPSTQAVVVEAETSSSEPEEEQVIPTARIVTEYPLTFHEGLWTPRPGWGFREHNKAQGVTLWSPVSKLPLREPSTTIWKYTDREQAEQVESFPPGTALWQPSSEQVSTAPREAADDSVEVSDIIDFYEVRETQETNAKGPIIYLSPPVNDSTSDLTLLQGEGHSLEKITVRLRGGAASSEHLQVPTETDDSDFDEEDDDDDYQGYPTIIDEEFELISSPAVSPPSSNGFSTNSTDRNALSQVYEYFGLSSDVPSWDAERAILLAKKKYEDTRHEVRRAIRNDDVRRARVPPRQELQSILNLAESVGLYDPQVEAARLRTERGFRAAARVEKETAARVVEAARKERLAHILARAEDPQEESSSVDDPQEESSRVNDTDEQLPAVADNSKMAIPSMDPDDQDTEMQDVFADAETDLADITNLIHNRSPEEAAALKSQMEDIEEISAWSDSDSDGDEDLQPTRPDSAMGHREAMMFTQTAPVREDPSSAFLVSARSSLRDEVLVKDPSPEPDVMDDLVEEWF